MEYDDKIEKQIIKYSILVFNNFGKDLLEKLAIDVSRNKNNLVVIDEDKMRIENNIILCARIFYFPVGDQIDPPNTKTKKYLSEFKINMSGRYKSNPFIFKIHEPKNSKLFNQPLACIDIYIDCLLIAPLILDPAFVID